jgi:hypothetical protein
MMAEKHQMNLFFRKAVERKDLLSVIFVVKL